MVDHTNNKTTEQELHNPVRCLLSATRVALMFLPPKVVVQKEKRTITKNQLHICNYNMKTKLHEKTNFSHRALVGVLFRCGIHFLCGQGLAPCLRWWWRRAKPSSRTHPVCVCVDWKGQLVWNSLDRTRRSTVPFPTASSRLLSAILSRAIISPYFIERWCAVVIRHFFPSPIFLNHIFHFPIMYHGHLRCSLCRVTRGRLQIKSQRAEG